MAYASSTDVAARLGRELDDTEAQIVAIRLSDAEILIRSRIKDLDDKVTAGDILLDAVIMIEAEMVLRLIRNPEGLLQESDGNYSYMVDSSVANGRLSVMDDEWRLLGVKNSTMTISMKVSRPTWADCPPADIDQWWFPDGTAVWDS